jgi:LmbE family N-acetylglucosaminyl deacetylase
LRQLYDATLPAIHAVDTGLAVSKDELTSILAAIMTIDTVDTVRGHAHSDKADGDHSDHHAAGEFVESAQKLYDGQYRASYYTGYPIRHMPQMLTQDQVAAKQLAFLAYTPHDPMACTVAAACLVEAGYGAYQSRQYRVDVDHSNR